MRGAAPVELEEDPDAALHSALQGEMRQSPRNLAQGGETAHGRAKLEYFTLHIGLASQGPFSGKAAEQQERAQIAVAHASAARQHLSDWNRAVSAGTRLGHVLDEE